MNQSPRSDEAPQHELRQLVHDVKNQLYVISMGLDVLDQLRDDPEKFDEILASIRNDGVEPLKKCISMLVDRASGSAR